MLKKTLLLCSVLWWHSIKGSAQQVGLINIDQLNERISKGGDSTYVINFWATWCVPCVKELPEFDALQQQYKNDKLKVLLVSVDYTSSLKTAVIPYVKKKKIASEVFVLNEKDQQEYIDRIDKGWSGTIPATLFIRKSARKFIERDFSLAELIKEYQNIL